MIPLKTKEEIKIMREGGRRLREALNRVLAEVRPGVTEIKLDKLAESEIKKRHGEASFKMVPGYKWATCITVNEEVVHGIPGKRVLREGDLVSLDMGMYFEGFHTDMATSFWLGKAEEEKEDFLLTGQRALEAAIKKVKAGNFVGDLSLVIEKEIKGKGYSPVECLTGHGVGRRLHEEPSIPCFAKGVIKKTPQIKTGMTLAIEIIYNQGSKEVILGGDGWTISTVDGKMSGLFEETVAVLEGGPLVLTR